MCLIKAADKIYALAMTQFWKKGVFSFSYSKGAVLDQHKYTLQYSNRGQELIKLEGLSLVYSYNNSEYLVHL